MAYLVKKSRKRGGAYKKSRYAKRRMTGGEYPFEFYKVENGETKYYVCEDDSKRCCKSAILHTSKLLKNDAEKYKHLRTLGSSCFPYTPQ